MRGILRPRNLEMRWRFYLRILHRQFSISFLNKSCNTMPDEFLSESLQMYLSLLEIDENASSFDDMFHIPLFYPPQKKLRKMLFASPISGIECNWTLTFKFHGFIFLVLHCLAAEQYLNMETSLVQPRHSFWMQACTTILIPTKIKWTLFWHIRPCVRDWGCSIKLS